MLDTTLSSQEGLMNKRLVREFSYIGGKWRAPTVVEPWAKGAGVRALSFTESTPIGKILCRQSASIIKHLVRELDGHGPLIVFKDAVFKKAAFKHEEHVADAPAEGAKPACRGE
jgi:Aldehyde dehydrogenase family